MNLLAILALSVTVFKCIHAGADAQECLGVAVDKDGSETIARLKRLDQYDSNRETKYYLEMGCFYLAQNHAEKYETESIHTKQYDAYYEKCLRAIWPRCSFGHMCRDRHRLVEYSSFKKGKQLGCCGMKSSFVAPQDGFKNPGPGSELVFYHKNKPPMDFKVLAKLPWPHQKDLLAYRDFDIKKLATSEREEQSGTSKVTIETGSVRPKYISFTQLMRWVQTFDLSKYDPVLIKSFRSALNLKYPGIRVSKVHKRGADTSVVPLYDPFVLIRPSSDIAMRYNPGVFELSNQVQAPDSQHSMIIAAFEHQGSTYLLMLSFDIA